MTPWMMEWLVIPTLKILVLFALVAGAVAYLVLFERRIMGFFQSRLGPNRVGPKGLLQPIADGVKLIAKEDLIPARAQKILFRIAPVFAVVPAFAGLAIIHWSKDWPLADGSLPMVVADVNVGILFLMAMASLGVYGIVLGGWSSGSKYPLMGSLRSASQMISYEIPLTLAILSVLVFAGSFRLGDIVAAQQKAGIYFIFPLFLGFIVYIISAVAENNRLPFDLPEAESELTGGFHTEYSGFRFAIFFLAEYTNMVLIACVATSLFLGGFDIPLANDAALYISHPQMTVGLQLASFLGKCLLFVYAFVWVRTTFPRYRYDQLLAIGWKVLLPLGVVNLFWAAFLRLWIGRGA